jgi:HMG-box domain
MALSTHHDMTTAAFIRFIRSEADYAEEKAQRWRNQANVLVQQYGEPPHNSWTLTMQQQLLQQHLQQQQLAPLDEHGLPKYKGKKRGRKPKKRQRVHDPNKPKRKHTAYTLFVKDNYPSLKALQPALQSKDIIGMVARQWAHLTLVEKAAWKERAAATHPEEDDEEECDDDEDATATNLNDDDNDNDDNDDDEENDDDQSVDDSPVEEEPQPMRKSGRGRPRKNP